jgi:RNA 3'-phosphate cyclase
MLEIDCSYGEGGGQIVRSALSLSVVTGTNIKLINIRSNRPNPGLAPQHITAVRSIAKLCNGKYSDLRKGEKELEFRPSGVKPGRFNFNIGTAGSITLVLQTLLIPTVFNNSKGDFKITIIGGTDVNWSPTFDYFNHVFLEHLMKVGFTIEAHLLRRGYYPKGGGEVVLKIKPNKNYSSLDLVSRGKFLKIVSIITSSHLPDHVPMRMKKSAARLLDNYSHVEIETFPDQPSYSPGTSILLYSKFENTVLGASNLGAKGVPAERVGAEVVEMLNVELENRGTVDINAADQLVPYLALIGGSITVRKISEHTKTNIWLVEQFFDKKFRVEDQKGFFKISF